LYVSTVNLHESRAQVEAFLTALPAMFQQTLDVECAFGAALEAATMLMAPIGSFSFLKPCRISSIKSNSPV
jgi:hypothetical protein